ncbi:MAG: glycogen debranching protein GlgX [Dermatophilaceae bacterium]
MVPRPQRPSVPPRPLGRDLPPRPGVTPTASGAEVAVYAGHAEAVDVCLFDTDDATGESERRVPLRERAHGWWFGEVGEMTPGRRYGIRAAGPWDPGNGLRYNPAKLLLDPYAAALDGEVSWGPEVYGHLVDGEWRGDGETRSTQDSRAHVPRSVVIDESFDWEDDRPPAHRRRDTVVYETHVRNQTMRHPGVPEHLRGTYAGLAHPASIEHLVRLGITAVELLPVQAFTSEPHLVRRGRRNHWGYNTLGFFAPHAGYAAASDPQGVVDEVKGMIKLLHRDGIEVLLDVVYNHTAEQGSTGATLSWRGLDQRAYYRLDEHGRDVDVTGCGNTLDLSHPEVCRMVLDSLRHWVLDYHVDGFRFDLAVALGRGRGGEFDPDHPFLVALRTDPVLSEVTLVAEPWDVGPHGWRTGQFPPPLLEWNDRFRDSARRFWVSDGRAHALGHSGDGTQDLATRLAGSRDLFGHLDRGPTASVNFVTAHDGFTLADLVSYDSKHNEANGEDNRDGTSHNASWNHGIEGPTDDAAVLDARARTVRGLLGTLLLSTGVPMLTAGDEMGRTQSGNNNAYCLDDETTWLDWDLAAWQQDLLASVQHLTAVRRALPVLRQHTWALGRPVEPHGILDMQWYAADGRPMGERWHEPGGQVVQMLVASRQAGEDAALVVLNGGPDDVDVRLPRVTGVTTYQVLWDSATSRLPGTPATPQPPGRDHVPARSLRVYAASSASAPSTVD